MSTAYPRQARAAMRALLTLTCILFAACGDSSRPRAKDVEQRLSFESSGQPLDFDVEQVDGIPDAGGRWRIRFSGIAKLREPMYRRVALADAPLSGQTSANLLALRNAAAAAFDLSPATRAPFEKDLATFEALPSSVLLPAMKTGDEIAFSGEGIAEPVGKAWSVEIESMKLAADGKLLRRSDSSDTPLFDSPEVADHLQALAGLASRLPGAVAAAEAAEHAAREQQAAAARAARAKQIQELATPGTFLLGTYQRNGDPGLTQVAFEIVSYDPADRSLVAHVRNEGSYRRTREVKGHVREEGNSLQLVFTFFGSTARRGEGPVMDWDDSRYDAIFNVTDDGLVCNAPRSTIRLRPAPADAMTKFRDKAGALEALTDQLLAPGRRLAGVGRSRDGTQPERLMMEVLEYRSEDGAIAMRMYDMRAPKLTQEYRGSVITNTLQAAQNDRMLVLKRSTDVPQTLENSFFENYGRSLVFAFAAGSFELRDSSLSLTLKPMTSDEHDAWAAEWSTRRQTWRSALAPGARYRGAFVTTRGSSPPLMLDLVWTVFEEEGKVLALRIANSQGKSMEFSGSVLLDQVLRVSRPIVLEGRMEDSPLGSDYTQKIEMTLDDNGRLVGEVSGLNRRFTLQPLNVISTSAPAITRDSSAAVQGKPFSAAVAAETGTVPAEYPKDFGAFLLLDGKWQPLPRNNARVAQNALNLFGSFVNSGNGAPLASIVMDGSDTVPTAHDAFSIFYRGTMTEMEGVPSDYPLAEIAPSVIDAKGVRKATLYRIAPGVAGFAQSRVTAQVIRFGSDSLLITVDRKLPAGRYVVSAGSDAFELSVQ